MDLLAQKYLKLTKEYKKYRKDRYHKLGLHFLAYSHRRGPYLEYVAGDIGLDEYKKETQHILLLLREGIKREITHPLPVVLAFRNVVSDIATELERRKDKEGHKITQELLTFLEEEYKPRK